MFLLMPWVIGHTSAVPLDPESLSHMLSSQELVEGTDQSLGTKNLGPLAKAAMKKLSAKVQTHLMVSVVAPNGLPLWLHEEQLAHLQW
jgi:hypothetical protein